MSSVAEKLQRKSERRSTGQAANTKQVRLRLVYIDFWSAVKLSFLVSICIGIVQVVSAFLIWMVLNSTGIFTQLNSVLSDILGDASFSVFESFSLTKVMIFSVILGLLSTVIGTFLGAIASLLYNLSVKITGGLLVGFTNN
ncbi:MAG: DUF3566 domain-containing protein [Microbacteriaceae bacterium]|mgnify:CR=1 FL=1|nr:DUF3566 domain-containing protein [Microbacteriaceae bacterium]